MRKAKLSIVLCTYNGEAYLREQLNSLVAQTRLPDEVVVGDDGSTDSSWEIILDFAQRAGRQGIDVRASRRPDGLGFVRNFSETMRLATGDLVFLCDQDDIWRPDKLAAMEAQFGADPELTLLWSDARLVDAAGTPNGDTLFEALELSDEEKQVVRNGKAFDVLLRRSMVTGATAALKRNVLDDVLPIGAGWIHDEWLAIVLSSIGRVGMVEQPFVDYRQHGGNQVGMRKRSWKDKWRGLVGPWSAHFQLEVTRLLSLEQHLNLLGGRVNPEYLRRVVLRREHFQRRAELGKRPRWERFTMVFSEAWRGNYSRFSTGRRSMLRDLLRHD